MWLEFYMFLNFFMIILDCDFVNFYDFFCVEKFLEKIYDIYVKVIGLIDDRLRLKRLCFNFLKVWSVGYVRV